MIKSSFTLHTQFSINHITVYNKQHIEFILKVIEDMNDNDH